MWPFDDVLGAINGLYDFFFSLICMAFYPVLRLVDVGQSWVNAGYSGIIEFINSLIGFPNILIDTFNSIFGFLPSPWLTVIAFDMVLIVAFRLYSFLKDIEIVGCKV